VLAASLAGVLLACGGAGATATAPRASDGPPAPVIATIKDAFHAAYNLDEPEALAAARRSVAMAPNEPATHRALASILWLAILYHRGAVFTDNYLSGSLKNQVDLPKPPPAMAAEFARELAAAIDLSEARLRKDPDDVQAHFDAGTAYALQASYTATVEGRVLGAMRMAKRAYDAEEFVLNHDPKRVEAGLIVGTYRYLVATLSMPARWMAYLVGFGGGKEHGIALIEDSVRAADTHVDSRVALLLIYSRERRFGDVVRLTRELQAEFPKNRLFTLEEGSAATRAGRPAEGESALTRGLAAYDREQRPRVEGERAVWLYKRAVARVALRRLPDAQADLDAAMRADPTDWTKGRVQLEVGRIADLGGRRNEALAAYRQAERLCTSRNDEICADEAERLTKRPFK
jgi:tetratricopeptide (TPR) repeat protein